MTLTEALHEFTEALFDMPDYPDQPGTVRCCGVPVVMQNGIRLECLVCRLTTAQDCWTVDDCQLGKPWHQPAFQELHDGTERRGCHRNHAGR